MKNLAVLVFATNNCYVKVVRIDDKEIKKYGLEIDLENGTWRTSRHGPRKIGEQRQTSRNDDGIIMVFDYTDFASLDALAHASTEATQNEGVNLDD